MNILVQLVHPAHFHYYRNAINNWKNDGHNVIIAITTKDILEELVKSTGLPYVNVMPISHKSSKIGYLYDMIMRDWRIFKLCLKHKIDILTGSSIEISHIGWLLIKPAINIGEDDAAVVNKYVNAIAPFVDCRLTPDTCNNGKIENRSVHHPGYLELAYLHPNHFTPNREVVEKYGIDTTQPYFILRFSSLNAHHDKGIRGINADIAQRLVDVLNPHGRIYITSERPLEPQFEQYRIKINPLDMHHVMAFASLYIGDSQTMAAEAGVLGTPFVRFNDFVGRIGYLDELEEPQVHPYVDYLHVDKHYDLGIGIRASEEGSVDRLVDTVARLAALNPEERHRIYDARRQAMLADKIDYAKFLTWFIENYPSSASLAKQPDFDWTQFK